MVREKFPVRLTPEERDQLEHLVRAGRSPARVGSGPASFRTKPGPQGGPGPGCGRVQRGIKRRFAEDGLDGVRVTASWTSGPEASDRPGLHPLPGDHWTLRALAGKAVELGLVESLSHETVRLRLKKTPSNHGRRSSGAFLR